MKFFCPFEPMLFRAWFFSSHFFPNEADSSTKELLMCFPVTSWTQDLVFMLPSRAQGWGRGAQGCKMGREAEMSRWLLPLQDLVKRREKKGLVRKVTNIPTEQIWGWDTELWIGTGLLGGRNPRKPESFSSHAVLPPWDSDLCNTGNKWSLKPMFKKVSKADSWLIRLPDTPISGTTHLSVEAGVLFHVMCLTGMWPTKLPSHARVKWTLY